MEALKGLVLYVLAIPAIGLFAVAVGAVLFGPPYLAAAGLERIHPLHGIVWVTLFLGWIALLYALIVEPGRLWARVAEWRESR